MECLTCKKHFSQGGNCTRNKNNCLLYDEEIRGKKIRITFSFKITDYAETPIIKYGSKVMFDDNGKDVEMTIIRINWINLDTMICNVEAEYYENEMPRFVKRRRFKLVK